MQNTFTPPSPAARPHSATLRHARSRAFDSNSRSATLRHARSRAFDSNSRSSAAAAKTAHTVKPEGYVILGIYPAGATGASPMAAGGKVVLFDTVAMAQQFVPLLGMGRATTWSSDGETAFWPALQSGGINRVDILTGYDPYNVPAGFPGGVRSEAKGLDWKNHVMWSHAFYDCGQFEKGGDGTLVNTALGSQGS